MSESFDQGKESLDREFEEFTDLSGDNWEGLINTGIPLYNKLKEAGDKRANNVRDTLLHTVDVIRGSGHASQELPNRILKGLGM